MITRPRICVNTLLGCILIPLLASATLRIMPLGDSITEGDYESNYRLHLERLLRAGNIDFDFVGSMQWGNDSLQDPDHEGHSGYKINHIRGGIHDWLGQYRPDIVLLMIGTNDMFRNYDKDTTIHLRLDSLIAEIFTLIPDSHIFLASIPPLNRAYAYENLQFYNKEIPGITASWKELGRAIDFVDVYSRLTGDDLSDGVHPNDMGNQKIGQAFFDAVSAVYTGNTTALLRRVPQSARVHSSRSQPVFGTYTLSGRRPAWTEVGSRTVTVGGEAAVIRFPNIIRK